MENPKLTVKISNLKAEMEIDYIEFFDTRAFADGNVNKGCYCVWHHWTDENEYNRNLMPVNERQYCKRDYAAELIRIGKLYGFVAYYDSKIVGFCNADIKNNYFRLSKENNPNSWKGTKSGEKILAIVCFVVAPNMRGKGIAKELLKYACSYAKDKGFDYIESYPSSGEFVTSNCCGPVSMYKSLGFEIIDISDGILARKQCNS